MTRTMSLLLLSLFTCASVSLADDRPAAVEQREALWALLREVDADTDLELVLLALGQAATSLDVDAATLRAALEAAGATASPLLVGAERVQVWRRPAADGAPDLRSIRILRPEPRRLEACWRGASSRRLELDRTIMGRLVDGRLVGVKGVRDLGRADEVEAPLVGLADYLGGGDRVSRPLPLVSRPRPRPGRNRRASSDATANAGQRHQMKSGTITINDRAYRFRSGGFGDGNLPAGEYTVTAHLWSRRDAAFTVGGVGWSFALSDKHDPRVGRTRTLLRIHPDGNDPGTEGCLGIIGDAETMRRFREDMRAELARSGGRFTLEVR